MKKDKTKCYNNGRFGVQTDYPGFGKDGKSDVKHGKPGVNTDVLISFNLLHLLSLRCTLICINWLLHEN